MKNMLNNLNYLNDTRFCMVYLTVLDKDKEKVQLVPIYGLAKVCTDKVIVEESSGTQHVLPTSALSSIQPNDGTKLLKDAANYVIVKIGERSRGN